MLTAPRKIYSIGAYSMEILSACVKRLACSTEDSANVQTNEQTDKYIGGINSSLYSIRFTAAPPLDWSLRKDLE